MTDPTPSLPPRLEIELLRLLSEGGTDLHSKIDDLLAAVEPGHRQAMRAVLAEHGGVQEFSDTGPTHIGPYKVLEKLGSGGMGAVYAAEQSEPMRRRVAVKVIKKGMATDEVLARFKLERRALAAMDHVAIARVFEAGETAAGEPYFAMELVRGLPLNVYSDKHRLSVEERIRLFQQVCEGVQHAHQKGVIHRDLKPTNVLIARTDDRHQPKILDFGLAKATNSDFLEVSVYTERDRVMGTPEYMSPEQAAGDGEVIDVRADVYSLGVMLYELLTGERPFTSSRLRQVGKREALRIIQTVEPPKPSTRLASSPQLAHESADRRRVTPAALSKACRGDLDWVVMRALAKEPERRYASAEALGRELQRYLDHEPVEAGPPSPTYRARKLLRRYRLQAGAAAAVFVAVLAGGIVAFLAERKASDRAAALERSSTALREQKQRLALRNEEFQQLAGVARYRRAIASLPELFPCWPDRIPQLRAWLADLQPLLEMRASMRDKIRSIESRDGAPLEAPLEALPGAPSEADESRNATELDEDAVRLLAEELRETLRQLETLEQRILPDVRDRRLRWATALETLENDPAWREAWATAAAAIAANPAYAGSNLGDLAPQRGLVPIGENPRTGLHEFYHLASAWDGQADPAAIRAPHHDTDADRLTVTADSGIVFVLLPAGELPGEVTGTASAIAPFFLARHELTRAQWQRLSFDDQDATPSGYRAGTVFPGDTEALGPTHPVENVTWTEATELLRRHGLQLPTGRQWQYGCLAGSSGLFHSGSQLRNLDGYANLADKNFGETMQRNGGQVLAHQNFDDGRAGPWPVGHGIANDFGLYDTHGNLFEWCRDAASATSETAAEATTPESTASDSARDARRMTRGGSFQTTARFATSAHTGWNVPSFRGVDLGLRAARSIDRLR